MKNKLNSIFTNELNMKIGVILAGVFVFANAIYSFAGRNIVNYLLAVERIFIFIMLLITVISYFKHDKNIMKCTIGCTISATILTEITTLLFKGFTIINIIAVIIPSIILISHLIINSDHHSNPIKIKFNQIFLLVTSLLILLLAIYSVIKSGWSLDFARNLSIYLFYIVCVLVLICIESKLDAYRIKREKGDK